MSTTFSTLGYVNRISENIMAVSPQELERLYHDITGAGVIIPSGEGRSKGALSMACSEIAKMLRGKIVVDRSDTGFPGADFAEAAPVLKQRFGQVCLLINSGSGKSMMPLIDAQKLGVYVAKNHADRDFRIDVVTSNAESPLGRLGAKFGNVLVVKGRETSEAPAEPSEFRSHGIMEDLFILGSGVLFHAIAESMYERAPADRVLGRSKELFHEIGQAVDLILGSDFFRILTEQLEHRHSCFFAGLGSSHEVARMTAVRVGHVKRAIGDQIYVAGESNTPAPRAGDVLLVVSHSGETEIVAGWCKNFRKMGGYVASLVGVSGSTIESMSDVSFTIPSTPEKGRPNSFYIKTAFALSPLPIYLVEKIEQRGLRLPEYVLKWYLSVTS
jgi:6-phospho-3-hexuloisomerase